MAQSSLRFAKIVATPTDTAWSQAYNEGGVFTILSLSKSEDIEPESLNTIGKEVLNIFRSEFFTLEEKTLSALKNVVHQSFEHVPKSVLVSFVVAFNKDDLLYLLVVGGGKVMMRRGDKTGVLLDKTAKEPERHITAASGVLKSDDLILLQTQEFAEKMTPETLQEALSLDLPNDIAEALTPKVHGSEQGASAAIILSYHGIPSIPTEESTEEIPEAVTEKAAPAPPQEDIDDDLEDTQTDEAEKTPVPVRQEAEIEQDADDAELDEGESRRRLRLPSLPKKTLILIGIAILLVGILISSILATKQHQQNTKAHEEFASIYDEAKNEFETGKELLSINPSLARDDFLAAQEILQKADGKFEEGTEEKKQLDSLKKQVEEQLDATSGAQTVKATEVKDDANAALAAEKSTKNALAVAEEDGTVSVLTAKNVSIDGKAAISGDWDKPVGLASYGGNIYVLDAADSIRKYVKSGNDYTDSNYLKGSSPDLTKAVSMGIDGSIYVLFSDGQITKYTKGVTDSFKLSGLTTPFSSPTRLFASSKLETIFILDPKHSRIVVLEKTGSFVKEISASILSAAVDLQIDSGGKTAYVLAKGKIYSLPLE
jgi:hypothetical protein